MKAQVCYYSPDLWISLPQLLKIQLQKHAVIWDLSSEYLEPYKSVH